jgi:putative FmdB family regulatory protein
MSLLKKLVNQMPIYEFECPKCEAIRELRLPYEHEAVLCETCEDQIMVKIISRGSFLLKGKGWFRDGY